ncbi:acyl-CoA dehydrogenase [Aquibacillus koreensis]|uniref:Acyl-CoA dehydrogenase n=1 Tax=Aquibacillus koreensis TaxID=279446 RepID=A0A9X3WIX4_9BACI|nr:acyl-CoA dehydrogenase [Aquibacillus koreensis]MCT2536479.1 acyl-CoA dehydrogenase [Aquibacillus koreensis]MDC3419433.1 acyl-CoA dehydrogenase [Aquibacillus koreensis]
MISEGISQNETLEAIIQDQLKPYVRKIDSEAYYAKEYLQALGRAGFYDSKQAPVNDVLKREIAVVEETAKYCMTTAFNLWCQLASMTYLRYSDNAYLKEEILPELEKGEVLGGTGLSNPMKFYGGMEKLHLQATRTEGGYYVSGTLPSVSNLGENHWFGMVAEVNEGHRVMAYVRCDSEGLNLKEKVDYLGLNGSATYACQFKDVFIPDKWVIAENADAFIKQVRPAFIFYQIPLGFGVTASSIRSILRARTKQGGCNSYLPVQADDLEQELNSLREQTYELAGETEDFPAIWEKLLRIRLGIAYLTSKAVHANMMHSGSAAYIQKSDPARRLRESYFLVNLTPTVRHLEKLLSV